MKNTKAKKQAKQKQRKGSEPLPFVVIVDCGSQLTRNIERINRKAGFRSVILQPDKVKAWVAAHPVKAVIISGSGSSVYGKKSPHAPASLFRLKGPGGKKVPILGICYGMQLLAYKLGGKVKPHAGSREYGVDAKIIANNSHPLFKGTPRNQRVSMSHGDSVTRLPQGFRAIARSSSGGFSGMSDKDGRVMGVQFHPEATHTIYGEKILRNFIERIAGCQKDWQASRAIGLIQAKLRQVVGRIGKNGKKVKAIMGFSGGVDSTTLSAMIPKDLKKYVLAVCIDGGHLRLGEMKEIKLHARCAGIRLKVVNAHKQFEKIMRNTVDAAKKRSGFSEEYVKILMREGKLFGATVVIQGTLAADLIESGATGGKQIKKHHNTRNQMKGFRQLHPLSAFFKYEVRALAQQLQMPHSVWSRLPFPGPGNFLRVIQIPATPENLRVVQWAYAKVEEILRKHGIYETLSQLVVYYGLYTVGVKGDERAYQPGIFVRGVKSLDFMTAEGVFFEEKVWREIESTLTAHPKICRAYMDSNHKPPATTEAE